MQDFPHHFRVSANGLPAGIVEVTGEDLEPVFTAPPKEFGGPGDRWSPESLLVAAVADCFILTFRAVAKASRLDWTSLRCEVVGTLDRQDRVTRFTKMKVHASLTVPPGTDDSKAGRLLEKAESGCLITNSLSAEIQLKYGVEEAD